MNFAAADSVVRAVLYEGYVLYPYRPSSIKNQQRWTFGGVYPPACPAAGASTMRTQCLVLGDPGTLVEARVRFLHPLMRQVGELTPPLDAWPCNAEPAHRPVRTLQCDGRDHYTWEESVERELRLPQASIAALVAGVAPLSFAFAADRTLEPITAADGCACGVLVRTQAAISGSVSIAAEEVGEGAYRLDIRIDNTTPVQDAASLGRDEVPRHAFISTHTILGVEKGEFVSLMDPPEAMAEAARRCTNQSAWPVLVGTPGTRDTLLCSPIILYDHPEIATESPGDLYDGTEIDEILTLRILTMTDAEKAEMMASDDRTRALLQRTEALTEEQMQQMHGVMRDPHPDPVGRSAFGPECWPASPPRLVSLRERGLDLRVGDHVRLRPNAGGDVFDLALAGHLAVIEAIEIDFDNRVHVAVTIDADPGRDLGMDRMPGHRFFFSPDEIEHVSGAPTKARQRPSTVGGST